MQDYPNFFSFGFGADVTMAGYFDALPLEVNMRRFALRMLADG